MQIVKRRGIYLGISCLIIIAGIVAMIINGASGKGPFNFDVEFLGGTSIEIEIGQDFNNDDITKIVEENSSVKNPQVQKTNDGHSVAIKTTSLTSEERTAIQKAISEKYEIGAERFTVQDVSATVSHDMIRDSIVSVVVACVCILIYISIRFKDFAMGVSSILALVHDALVVLGAYAIFRTPMNNSFIAAVLTVIGYSINASIVIFDRVRENRARIGRNNFEELINASVKMTLTRSLFTSLTTFFTVACLWVFGVASVKEFVFPIAVGIVAGTYSSVFVAGNIWYMLASSMAAKKNAQKLEKLNNKKSAKA